MKVFYAKDADLSAMLARNVTIIGYGSQGFAHANNLRDSGIRVTLGLRHGSPSWQKACDAGFSVTTVAEAVAAAEVVMLLAPDECHAAIYAQAIEPHMRSGAALAFAHGFSVHYAQIKPRADIDVIMIAPKGPGHLVRATYQQGTTVPSLIAVHQDYSGQAKQIALAYAVANGGSRSVVMETSFREETETDLFGEQAVLCGGCVNLVKAGFETLVEAGYAEEMAYFECLHELKLVVDLLYEGGISTMNYAISNNAEYGEYVAGESIINETSKQAMRRVLQAIQNGEYAKSFILEHQAGQPRITAQRRINSGHPIEQVGKKLRALMPWITQQRLVDQTKN